MGNPCVHWMSDIGRSIKWKVTLIHAACGGKPFTGTLWSFFLRWQLVIIFLCHQFKQGVTIFGSKI